MSYLPRMSKTYREPISHDFYEPEESSPTNTVKPASSLLNDKSHNPQTILKHYRYHPHPLPVLPGPSLLEEVMENELYNEASRLRRSASKMETISKNSKPDSEELAEAQQEEDSILESESITEENFKRPQSRKGIKKSKSSLVKRKSTKYLKRDSGSKLTVNMCLVKTERPFTRSSNDSNSENIIGDYEFISKYEQAFSEAPKSPKTQNLMELIRQQTMEIEKVKDRSTQCAIVGTFTKEYVIPTVLNSLLRTLLFLLQEVSKETINKYTREQKTTLAQCLSSLEILCNERVDKEYCFDITYSDFKRIEKILGELKKYLKDVYGDQSEFFDKMEDLKRVFIELRKKDMELFDMSEKLTEINDVQIEIAPSEKDLKNPEVTLQNNRLESEQLSAEVEFSLMELRNYQATLAELDWDIINFHKQMNSLKKSSSSSKTESLGRKCCGKFSNEGLPKVNRNLDNETNIKKKT